jgi:hypothetical protein
MQAVQEVTRRAIRGGEDVDSLIEELTKGFSKEDKTAVSYSVKVELGFGINEEEINTKEKEERKPEAFQTGTTFEKQKSGKGSRSEDVKDAITKEKDKLKKFKEKMKEAEEKKYSRSQDYRVYKERVEDAERRIKELQAAGDILSKAAWYCGKYDSINPVTPINVFEKLGKIYVTIKTAMGETAVVPQESLDEKPAFASETPADKMYQEFKNQVVGPNNVLQAVQGLDITTIQGDNLTKNSFEKLAAYLERFIQKLKERDPQMTMDQTEKDNAYSSVKQFINNILKEASVAPEVKGRLATLEKTLDEMSKIKEPLVSLSSIGNPEKLLAYALMTVDDITSKVADIQKQIPATDYEILGDIKTVNDTMTDVKRYVSDMLPSKGRDEQIAAATVLQNVASDLKKAFTALSSAVKPAAAYVIAYEVKPKLKVAAMMLKIVGD